MSYTHFFEKSERHEFGIKMKGNSFVFLVPDELYISENDLKTQTQTLLTYSQILFRYYHHKKKESKEDNAFNNFKNRDNEFDKLQAMITLFSDYINDDIFRMRQTVNSINSKRINWTNTFRKSEMIINKRTIIPAELHSNNFKDENESDFMLLYYHALNLAHLSFQGTSLFDIEAPKLSQNYITAVLNRFLDENYGDREILIAKTLKSFYLNNETTLFSKNLFSTPYHENFEYIWEFMVEQIIPKSNNKDLKSLLHKDGRYYKTTFDDNGNLMVDDNILSNGLDYRIDHLYYNEKLNYIAILDSKFYNFYNDSTNSPKSESIGKQANYKKRIQEKLNNEKLLIQNFFVFPKQNKKGIELFAIHRSNNDGNKFDEDFDIYCLAIDIFQVIDLFIKKRKCFELESLILKTKNTTLKYKTA